MTEDQISALCANVTEQQRQYCAEHMDGADFPERVLRQSSRKVAIEFDPTPLSVECLWGMIIAFEPADPVRAIGQAHA